MLREKINLIAITYTENDMGDPIETKTKTEVYAEKKAVSQTAFYQAAANGMRPEWIFVVRSDEYKSEPKLEYESEEYTIIRAYERKDKMTELTCQGLVSDDATT
jgi:SPP1 family predicted phage head-tail adaptor